MKLEKFGLPGSVAVIGPIYLMALAVAPTPSLSAQTGSADRAELPTVQNGMDFEASLPSLPTGDKAGHPSTKLQTAGPSAKCFSNPGSRMTRAKLIQVHLRLLDKPLQTAEDAGPAPGTGKSTIF